MAPKKSIPINSSRIRSCDGITFSFELTLPSSNNRLSIPSLQTHHTNPIPLKHTENTYLTPDDSPSLSPSNSVPLLSNPPTCHTLLSCSSPGVKTISSSNSAMLLQDLYVLKINVLKFTASPRRDNLYSSTNHGMSSDSCESNQDPHDQCQNLNQSSMKFKRSYSEEEDSRSQQYNHRDKRHYRPKENSPTNPPPTQIISSNANTSSKFNPKKTQSLYRQKQQSTIDTHFSKIKSTQISVMKKKLKSPSDSPIKTLHTGTGGVNLSRGGSPQHQQSSLLGVNETVNANGVHQRSCMVCSKKKTGQWRRGPAGPRTLCNACGLEWTRKIRSEATIKGISIQESERILAIQESSSKTQILSRHGRQASPSDDDDAWS